MSRQVPSLPSLEFDRKQAKLLLVAARKRDATAIERVRGTHPRFRDAGDQQVAEKIALKDCQLVVAREYGFASWPRWKQFAETRRLSREARAAVLVKAACSNDVRRARVMLEVEPALAGHDIFTAAACGDFEAWTAFLFHNLAIFRAKGGPLACEPILYACFSRFLRADPGRRDGIVRVVRLLLDRGADPNASFSENFGGSETWSQPCLYGAAGIANDAELTTMLLDAGGTIADDGKSAGGAGAEALYHATEFPDPTCLRLLLERGRPHVDRVQFTLGRATDFEYPAHVALYLAHGADPNYCINWDGERTQLHKAVYVGRSVEIVRQLVDAGGDVNATDAHGVSILRSAVRNGHRAAIDLLIARGARDDGVTDADARQGDPITLCLAAGRDDVATIDRLLDAGADPNRPAGPDGTPPLHWAAWRGRFNAMKRLVERGADIHWVNGYGGAALGTAIHGSANCFDPEGGPGMRLPEEAIPGDYPAIVEFLIARGAKRPDRISGGSEAVQDVLRRHGVLDGEPDR